MYNLNLDNYLKDVIATDYITNGTPNQDINKLVCLNRNRKVVFVDLDAYTHNVYQFQACVLPDDLFILGLMIDGCFVQNFVNQLGFRDTITDKEKHISSLQYFKSDWIYEEDFRRKDSYFFFLEYQLG